MNRLKNNYDIDNIDSYDGVFTPLDKATIKKKIFQRTIHTLPIYYNWTRYAAAIWIGIIIGGLAMYIWNSNTTNTENQVRLATIIDKEEIVANPNQSVIAINSDSTLNINKITVKNNYQKIKIHKINKELIVHDKQIEKTEHTQQIISDNDSNPKLHTQNTPQIHIENVENRPTINQHNTVTHTAKKRTHISEIETSNHITKSMWSQLLDQYTSISNTSNPLTIREIIKN